MASDSGTPATGFPDYKMVMESPTMRAVVFDVGAKQEIPWHRHSQTEDHFYCLLGPMTVELREPHEVIEIASGENYAVPAQRPHYVHGKDYGPCKFLLLQGVGKYDNEIL